MYDEPDILEDYVLSCRNKGNTLDANHAYFLFYESTTFKNIEKAIQRVRSQLKSLNIPAKCLSIYAPPYANGIIVKLDYKGLKLLLAKSTFRR